MVGNTVLSTALIQLIDAVAASESEATARQTLLKALLDIFQLDQAALFTKESPASAAGGEDFHCLLAVDRTGKILQAGNQIFGSMTLLEKSLLAMEPVYLRISTHDALTPKSVKDDSLKQIVCLPLTRAPGTAIFLGSRSLTERNFSEEEIGQFRTASRAAWLAVKQFKTQETLSQTRQELKSLREERASLIYSSQVMSEVVDEVARVAPFNISLLLVGESGVGKEELARFAHAKSGRAGAFVAVNCANLSESLLESELFGYRKGAFTGAMQNKDGLFKAADGGTIFLDELAEMPVNLQAKLLRALQERKIRAVGSTEDTSVDVRVIAATHQDLESRIERGEFRADLFYRVQEFTVRIPSLRERPEDIELLAEHFIALASLEMNLPRRTLGPESLKKLQDHPWPGNVRELKSICRTAVILARTPNIQASDLRLVQKPKPPAQQIPVTRETSPPDLPRAENIDSGSLRDQVRNLERQAVKKGLSEGLSQVEVASRLGISVRTLQRILTGGDGPSEARVDSERPLFEN